MTTGKLIIIGGHEDKQNDEVILKEVVGNMKADGSLVIITAATEQPEVTGKEYTRLFRELGADRVKVLNIDTREQAHDDERVKLLEEASVVFFTGGDQLRITSHIGDSPVFRCMQRLHERGVLIAGTSAGAAAMPHTMLISGTSDKSGRMSAIGMAPGLGFIDGVVIDSHFAERGRIGRLLGAVAQNPANLGVGIDEDTAIVVHDGHFRVIGSGAVYALDGSSISYSSVSDEQPEGILSVFDVRLHVLGEGDAFDLAQRRPLRSETSKA